jgi:hypothetical protein
MRPPAAVLLPLLALLTSALPAAGCRSRLPVAHVPDLALPSAPPPAPTSTTVGVVEYYQISDG